MRWWMITWSFITELFNGMLFLRDKSRIGKQRWFFLSSNGFTPLMLDMERAAG
jgi:hypothetical protein